ncbi:outer membrane beta-barrel family protein, partial [Hymenobacter agri]
DSAAAATIAADADYARYRTTRRLTVSTFFDLPAEAPALLDGDQLSDLSIAAFKVDYGRPLPRRARLEAGLKATRVRSDNNVVFVNTENGVRTYNADISNAFRYDENVNAAYLSYRSGPGPTSLQLGLRAEQTNTRAAFADSLRERHYVQLFPSATVQHRLNPRHSLSLALARRIDRPTYRQLNPLRTYLDATSYQAGNRNLVAQTSYNAEISHTYRQKFVTALAYARTSLPIVNVVQPSPDGGRLVVNQDVNLRTEHYYSLTLTAPLDLAKWCSLYANGVFYYARYLGSLANTTLDRGRAACTLTLNGSFTLPGGWTADLSSVYESGEQYGFEYIRPRGQLAMGLKKSCLQQRGTLTLNAADVLYTTPIRTTSTYNNFVETFYSRQDTRVVTAAFAYRFGNSKVVAARKRTAGAEDELRRAGGL